MAKRLTDTEKWNDDWFLSLSNDYRIIWQWLIDNCNHAGICKRNIKLLNVMCNTEINEDVMIQSMDGRVIIANNNWFIPKFLKFQYADLQSNRPVIISVRKELFRSGYYRLIPKEFGNDYLIIPESFNNDYSIIKDKSKDKDINSLTKTEKNGKTEFSNNFKARGEEVLVKGYLGRLEEKNRSGEEDNGSEV